MEPEVYQQMKRIEDKHWWFLEHQILVKKHISTNNNTLLLDIGCGTGKILSLFSQGSRVGLDIEDIALKLCREKKLPHLLQADAFYLPFKEETFDYALILQVLYHRRAKEEKKVLKEVWRVLKRGGILLITEPAFEFLRREHDIVEHTRKRFTREELTQVVSEAGFKIVKTSYVYSYALPLILLIKLFKTKRKSDLYLPPVFINTFFKLLGYLEARLLSFFPIPFGSTVFVLAKKR